MGQKGFSGKRLPARCSRIHRRAAAVGGAATRSISGEQGDHANRRPALRPRNSYGEWKGFSYQKGRHSVTLSY